MADINIQTDHRDLSDAVITQRMQQTCEGDKILFNDRKEPLTVIECSDDRKEWEVHFRTEDGREVVEVYPALSKDDLVFEVGEEIDAWKPHYEVTDIIEHSSRRGNDSNAPWVVLEGPQGGKYKLEHSLDGIKSRNVSDGTQLDPWGANVWWFQNQSQE